jgi:hypothetical protein
MSVNNFIVSIVDFERNINIILIQITVGNSTVLLLDTSNVCQIIEKIFLNNFLQKNMP